MSVILNNRFTQFLSRKSISAVIILFAIGSKALQLLFFFNIRVDGMYQYLAMKYFVNGHGVSIAEVLPGNLSQPVYEPLINWPPGYSLLLSPFYLLFNHNYIAAGLCVDIIAAVALIIYTRKILKQLGLPAYLINIFTIFTGFFIYNFYFIASSDAIAISFFMIALYHTIVLLKTNTKWLFRIILISVLLTLCGFIKYLFYPVVFTIPFFLIAKGLVDKLDSIKKAGLISLAIVAVVLISLLIFQKNISGAAMYISQPERGFYPENLSMAYPFIPGALANPESITRAIGSLAGSTITIFRLFQLVHIISLLGISIYIVYWIRKKGLKNLSLKNSFLVLASLVSLSIFALLFILSITVAKEEINPGVFWSYIEDARYHGLITVLLQMSFFIFAYQLLCSSFQKKFLITSLFIILLIPETSRGLIFDINRIAKLRSEKYSWQSEFDIQKYAEAIISKKKTKLKLDHVVVTGTSYYLNYRVCLYSDAFYLKDSELINRLSHLNSSKAVLLLVILDKNKTNAYPQFLNAASIEYEGSYEGFNFYSTLIKAH